MARFWCNKFFIENPNTGQFYKFHQIKYTNTSTLTSIQNPNGFLRVEVYNDATTNDVVVQTPSMSVGYENEPNKNIGIPFSVSNVNSVTINTLQSILSIRSKTFFKV